MRSIVGRTALDDIAAHPAQRLDAVLGAAVDGLLHGRHEQCLRQQVTDAQHQCPRFQPGHVPHDAQQDAGLQQRLGDRHADEAADRLGLGHRHGGMGAGCVGFAMLGGLDILQGLAQGAHCILAHPAAIDVQHHLQDLLEQGDAGIGDGQPHDGFGRAILDGVVDDPSLKFEGNAAQAKYGGRQDGERDLMAARAVDHVTHDRPWQRAPVHGRKTLSQRSRSGGTTFRPAKLSSRAQRGTFPVALKVPRCARDDSDFLAGVVRSTPPPDAGSAPAPARRRGW